MSFSNQGQNGQASANQGNNQSGVGSQDTNSQLANTAVPLFDLSRQHAQIKDQMAAALGRVCQSGAFVLGPEVTQLETSVAAYSQSKHAVGCASGSDALLLALMALDIGPRDEVILPSFTFFATASAVTRLGRTSDFLPTIDPQTYNINPAEVARLISPRTKAILPVHLFGQMADMDALGRIAASANIPIVEDAAQAIGGEWKGRRAGSIGAVGCFSFYPTKNLGGAPEMAVCSPCNRTRLPIGYVCCEHTACGRAITTLASASIAGSTHCKRQC